MMIKGLGSDVLIYIKNMTNFNIKFTAIFLYFSVWISERDMDTEMNKGREGEREGGKKRERKRERKGGRE